MTKLDNHFLNSIKIGDCYIKEVDNSKFGCLQRKYLIIICCGQYIYNYTKKGVPQYRPTVYIKISKEKPQTKEDVDCSEFIISCLIHYSERFFPYDGNFSNEELKKIRSKIKLPNTDSHGFLIEYQYKIWGIEKDFFKDCTYLYHPNFKKPKNEFFHWKTETECHFQGLLLINEKNILFDELGYDYYYHNLRNGWEYKIPSNIFIKYKNSYSKALADFHNIWERLSNESKEEKEEKYKNS